MYKSLLQMVYSFINQVNLNGWNPVKGFFTFSLFSAPNDSQNYFLGQYEIAEDALERELSSVGKREKLSSSGDEMRQLISDVDLTEPLAPVVVEAARPIPRPVEPQSSPTKADKILALISEIGANQMLTNMEDFQPWFWEHSPGKLINI